MDRRNQALRRLANEKFDLLVIGGGATGAGIALDASLRGLKVALAEAQDFASGASGRSTKLVHGGFRYLEKAVLHFDRAQYRLVKEGLNERHTLLKIAPHLTRPLPIIVPVHSRLQQIYFYMGCKLYERLAGDRAIGRSTLLSRASMQQMFPLLQSSRIQGGIEFFDGQFDDARMNLALILSACDQGTAAANYLEVAGFRKQAGRITHARVREALSKEVFDVEARVVINASGCLSDYVRRLDCETAAPIVQGSQGTHLIIDASFSSAGRGLLIPRPNQKVLFILPWKGKSLIGTTDLAVRAAKNPQPTSAEIEELIVCVREELGYTIERSKIKASWAGIRPLIIRSEADTSKVSREAKIVRDPSGLYSMIGGKWTTYRKMAEDILDAACRDSVFPDMGCCKTATHMLRGAEGFRTDMAVELQKIYSLDLDVSTHIAHTYGSDSLEVLETCKRKKDGFSRLSPRFPFLAGEIDYARIYEFACSAEDVLFRRMALGLLDQEETLRLTPQVAQKMAEGPNVRER